MTAPPGWLFPGNRAIASWWRSLAQHRPTSLWFAQLPLYQVEASVRTNRASAADPFKLLTLAALARNQGASCEQLHQALGLRRQFLQRILRCLQAKGLATVQEPHGWTLTTAGLQAQDHPAQAEGAVERRSFHFRATPPMHFVALQRAHATVPAELRDNPFDPPGLLEACLHQSTTWKQQQGFPQDVLALFAAGAIEPITVADWDRLTIVRPICLPLVLVTTELEGGRLLGFPFEPGSLASNPGEPVLSLDAELAAAFPELRKDPPLEAWEQAWSAWWQEAGCSPSVPKDLRRHDAHTLHVRLARELLDRLRREQAGLVGGGVWLLAGEGPFRLAARVELQAE